MEPLTTVQRARLAVLKVRIHNGIKGWIEGGEALLEIHTTKLYKEEFNTFREFCLAEFKMTDQHARRLMDAAQVVKSLKSEPAGSLSQSAALALKDVPEDERELVLDDAASASSASPAAPAIKAAVTRRKAAKAPPAPAEHPDHTETQDALQTFAADNERLTRENDALAATDQGRQIAAMNVELGQLRGRIDQLLTENKEAIKQAKYFQRICDRLRDLLGLSKASQLYATVEELKVLVSTHMKG